MSKVTQLEEAESVLKDNTEEILVIFRHGSHSILYWLVTGQGVASLGLTEVKWVGGNDLCFLSTGFNMP